MHDYILRECSMPCVVGGSREDGAIRVEVGTESAKLLFLYWDPGKPCTVVLYRKCCFQNISILCKAANMNTLRASNMGQRCHFIF